MSQNYHKNKHQSPLNATSQQQNRIYNSGNNNLAHQQQQNHPQSRGDISGGGVSGAPYSNSGNTRHYVDSNHYQQHQQQFQQQYGNVAAAVAAAAAAAAAAQPGSAVGAGQFQQQQQQGPPSSGPPVPPPYPNQYNNNHPQLSTVSATQHTQNVSGGAGRGVTLGNNQNIATAPPLPHHQQQVQQQQLPGQHNIATAAPGTIGATTSQYPAGVNAATVAAIQANMFNQSGGYPVPMPALYPMQQIQQLQHQQQYMPHPQYPYSSQAVVGAGGPAGGPGGPGGPPGGEPRQVQHQHQGYSGPPGNSTQVGGFHAVQPTPQQQQQAQQQLPPPQYQNAVGGGGGGGGSQQQQGQPHTQQQQQPPHMPPPSFYHQPTGSGPPANHQLYAQMMPGPRNLAMPMIPPGSYQPAPSGQQQPSMQPQLQMQQPPQQQQMKRQKKPLQILDPSSGKNILDDLNAGGGGGGASATGSSSSLSAGGDGTTAGTTGATASSGEATGSAASAATGNAALTATAAADTSTGATSARTKSPQTNAGAPTNAAATAADDDRDSGERKKAEFALAITRSLLEEDTASKPSTDGATKPQPASDAKMPSAPPSQTVLDPQQTVKLPTVDKDNASVSKSDTSVSSQYPHPSQQKQDTDKANIITTNSDISKSQSATVVLPTEVEVEVKPCSTSESATVNLDQDTKSGPINVSSQAPSTGAVVSSEVIRTEVTNAAIAVDTLDNAKPVIDDLSTSDTSAATQITTDSLAKVAPAATDNIDVKEQRQVKSKGKKRAKEINMKGESLCGDAMDAFRDLPGNELDTSDTDRAQEVSEIQPIAATLPPSQSTVDEKHFDIKPNDVALPQESVETAVEATDSRTIVDGQQPHMEEEKLVTEIPIEVVATALGNQVKEDEVKENGIVVTLGDDEDDSEDLTTVVTTVESSETEVAVDNVSCHIQDGRIVYERDFLLQLQRNEKSMAKPDGLPQIEIVKDSPSSGKQNTGMTHNLSFKEMTDISNMSPFTMGGGMIPGGRHPPRPGGGSIGPPGPRGGRGSHSQKGIPARTNKVINVSIGRDVSLNTAGEKAWKPAYKDNKVKDADDVKTEELVKKVRGILNKLTPQKFSTLVEQVMALEIDNEDRLRGVIELVFEKAVGEPAFSVAYANLCKCLLSIKVPSSKEGEIVHAKKLLLNKCQHEFEKDKQDEETFKKMESSIAAAETEDQKKQFREDLELLQTKSRRRSLGNIRFIGELFKLRILTETIMHDCIMKLLKNDTDEESLECFCRLMSTIGKDMDTATSNKKMSDYIKRINDIIKAKRVSSRIRFALQDVVDLRENKWVPRRDEGPKTIDQIHQDAAKEREQADIQNILFQQNQRAKAKEDSRRPGYTGRGSSGPPPMKPEAWTNVAKGKPTLDAKRLLMHHNKVGENSGEIKLGPGGGGPRWMTGSSGGGSKSGSREEQKPSLTNKYSVLSSGGGDKDISTNFRPGRGETAGAAGAGEASRSPTPSSGQQRKVSMPSEREQALQAVQAIGRTGGGKPPQQQAGQRGSQQGNRRTTGGPASHPARSTPGRSGSRGSRDRRDARDSRDSRGSSSRDTSGSSRREASAADSMPPPPPPAAAAATLPTPSTTTTTTTATTTLPLTPLKDLTDDEMEKKAHAIMEEYLGIHDVAEAITCISDINHSPNLYIFVEKCVSHVLERSSQARVLTGELFCQCVSKNKMRLDTFIKGIVEQTSFAEEMETDIPFFYKYLGEILGPMVSDNMNIPLDFLKDVTRPLLARNKAGLLVAATMHQATKQHSKATLSTLWQQFNLHWEDFLAPETSVVTFVREQKVEYTVPQLEMLSSQSPPIPHPSVPVTAAADANHSSQQGMTIASIDSHLKEALLNRNANNDVVFDWIADNVDENMVESKDFIRILISVVTEYSISLDKQNCEIQKDKLKSRVPILKKYLDNVAERELQALYGLQAYIHELNHPPGILRSIFDCLYDEEAISEEAFLEWESSDDLSKGKGVALKSVAQFLTWLKESEADEESPTAAAAATSTQAATDTLTADELASDSTSL